MCEDKLQSPEGRRRSSTYLFLVILFALLSQIHMVEAAASCDDHLPFGAPSEVNVNEGDRVTICQDSADQTVSFFVSRYDRDRVATDWTAYELTREKLVEVANSSIIRENAEIPFAPDPGIEVDNGFKSPRHTSFNGIGNLRPPFDRGHLAPAGTFKWNIEGYQRTFIVSNLAIQANRFNRQLWQDVEAQARGWACEFDKLYVLIGTVHGSGVSTFALRGREDESHIPTHFYMLVYTPHKKGKAVALIYLNAPPKEGENVASGAISVAALQSITDLRFFPEMSSSRRKRIISEKPDLSFWGFDYPRGFQCSDEE